MTRRRGPAVVLLLACAVATSADPPAPVPGGKIERTREFTARLDRATDRGVEWLREAQLDDGSYAAFPGYPCAVTALAYCTLRACGVPKSDGCADRAWKSLRVGYKKSDLLTYSAALYLMAIAAHGDPVAKPKDDRDVKLNADDAKWAAEVACCLAGGQDADGAWTYGVDRTAKGGAPTYAGVRPSGVYDHSNTQYALLGLKAAARCSVPIEPAVWKRSLQHLIAAQIAVGPEVRRAQPALKNGETAAVVLDHARGWGYEYHDPRGWDFTYPSMTAGGVSSIVICRSELLGTREATSKLDADSERAAWDGLAWLGTHWPAAGKRAEPVEKPPPGTPRTPAEAPDARLDCYELYGIERAGVLAGVDWMADVDWHGRGAERLLAAQAKNGSWTGVHEGLVAGDAAAAEKAHLVADTCFALLFLRKGTTPTRRGAVTQVGEDVDINFVEAAKTTGRDLEDFLELVLTRWRKSTDDGVKTRLFDGATLAGPKIVEPLLMRLDAADVDKRAAAFELLHHATGLDFGFIAADPPEPRAAAIAKWQAWWMTSKDKIAYDPETKRLVVK